MQAQELDENNGSSNSASLLDEKNNPKKVRTWNITLTDRLLISLILFVWYGLFYSAPGYVGFHDKWEIQFCSFASLACAALGNINLAFLFLKYIDKLTSVSSAVIILTVFTILTFLLGNSGDIKHDPSGLIQSMRLLAFVGSLGSSLGIIMYMPRIFSFIVDNYKSVAKLFNKKNLITVILSILAVSTAIFQLIQVLIPLIYSKH